MSDENQKDVTATDAPADVHLSTHTSEEISAAGEMRQKAAAETEVAIAGSLLRLGFVNFDQSGSDNTTFGAMVAPAFRKDFRRDVYVGISDKEQNLSFLGRIVEGPFHAPHEVGADSAITRTTVLHPERTQFRPTYYVYGTIEVLGVLGAGERLNPTPTRPRPYSEIFVFPEDRLRKLLDIEGNFYLGHLMGSPELRFMPTRTKELPSA
jgi:uncharacterized protein